MLKPHVTPKSEYENRTPFTVKVSSWCPVYGIGMSSVAPRDSNPRFSHDPAYRTKSTRSACVSRSAPLSVTSTVSLKESPIAETYM